MLAGAAMSRFRDIRRVTREDNSRLVLSRFCVLLLAAEMAAKLSSQLKKWRGVIGHGRKARGANFTQDEAASRLGVSLRTYQQWEHGRHEPRGLALKTVKDQIARARKPG